MKKIQAIIRSTKYEQVRDALHKIGVESFIFYEVKGVSFQIEQKGSYRGMSTYDSSGSIPRRVIEVVVPEDDVAEVIQIIKKAAYTGEVGDGKIYISAIETAIRISIK
ncbi:MAG: P-II family nitrogen regulator [Cytophagales bacterium]|nr:P-II family nitrogen regulator [Cytophagales bacterium]